MGKIISLAEAEAIERVKQCQVELHRVLSSYNCSLSVRQTFVDGQIDVTEYRVIPLEPTMAQLVKGVKDEKGSG